MTSPDKDVAAIEARLAAATPGPWEIDRYARGGGRIATSFTGRDRRLIADTYSEGDRELLYHAPADIAALLAQIDRLHSWDGLMSLLDEHWPEWMMPTLPDREGRDPGPRIVSLLRWVERQRATLDRVTDLFEKWAAEENEHRLDGELGIAEGLHVASDDLREAVHGEPTDPGCPHCGDFSDPDQPSMHARCRRIPDYEEESNR